MKKKVLIQNPPQNPNDIEILGGKALDELTQIGKQEEKNRLSIEMASNLSVEAASSLAIRWIIITLGSAACVMIFLVVYMYSVLLISLTNYFSQNTSMLINFLTETWRTITSASAAAVPFLVYLLRKQTKDR